MTADLCKNKIQEKGICQGCIESDGHCMEWTQSNGCPIHKCAREHNVQFCGLCKEFPCEWLIKKIVWRKKCCLSSISIEQDALVQNDEFEFI